MLRVGVVDCHHFLDLFQEVGGEGGGGSLASRMGSLLEIMVKVCLHVPTQSLSPSQCPSKFNIVPMVTGSLTGKMGVEPILPVRRPVTKI